jgi:hypothetical protein
MFRGLGAGGQGPGAGCGVLGAGKLGAGGRGGLKPESYKPVVFIKYNVLGCLINIVVI